jgi:hypothetical protein
MIEKLFPFEEPFIPRPSDLIFLLAPFFPLFYTFFIIRNFFA